ncbi:MAG: hypothetical protein C4K49_03960 [Candidatus Thorarchaeota archaeon]|nr:MAG: hypothetical protein C4K49_03960 [Candidatus Thorarchaeota archaeon]
MPEDAIIVKSDRETASLSWDHYVHLLGWALVSLVAYSLWGILASFISIWISDYWLLGFLSSFGFIIFCAEIIVLLLVAIECLQASSR